MKLLVIMVKIQMKCFIAMEIFQQKSAFLSTFKPPVTNVKT